MKKIVFIKESVLPPTEENAKIIQDFIGEECLVLFADIEECIYVKEI